MSGGTILTPGGYGLIPATTPPATIAASGTYPTGILPGAGYRAFAAGCTLSQAGTIVIHRYLDLAGTIEIGTGTSSTLSANTANTVEVHDGIACASWQVIITNTGGVTGNLTNTAFVAVI